jgi:hypothetical protein
VKELTSRLYRRLSVTMKKEHQEDLAEALLRKAAAVDD